MAKTKISEFSSTPVNNTDIDSINIAEGCAPSGINDAIRELMAQLKDFQTGAQGDSFNGPVGTTTAVAGAFTTLSASGTTTLSGLTASTALALDASKNVVSVTNTGTGNNVLATSPTLVTPALGTPSSATLTNATGLPISTGVSGLGTGIATALAVNVGTAGAPVINGGALGTPSSGTVTNLTGTASININGTVGATTANTGAFTTLTTSSTVTLNGGTANGVAYLNGSKVLTTGSALTFDGTVLNASTGTPVIRATASTVNALYGLEFNGGALDAFVKAQPNSSELRIASGRSAGWGGFTSFYIDTAEKMRLTSTGLGIGTSSPAFKLDVGGDNGTNIALRSTGTTSAVFRAYVNSAEAGTIGFLNGGGTYFEVAGTEGMRLTSTGLGIGTSAPSTKLHTSAYAAISATFDRVGDFGQSLQLVRNGVAGNAGFGLADNKALGVYLDSSEVGRWTSTGLGIGTSSPWAKLSIAMSNGQMGLANGNTSGGVKIQAWNAAGNDDGYLAFEGYTKEYGRFDSSGNLGLGVTPSAWASRALQVGSYAGLTQNDSLGSAELTYNCFRSSGSTWNYINSDTASRYRQWNSSHAWFTAPSGTAGNAISFTQALSLTAAGNLLLGGTTDPGGTKVLYIGNGTTPGTPTSGGVLYVESGALKYKGSSGTVTTLGAA